MLLSIIKHVIDALATLISCIYNIIEKEISNMRNKVLIASGIGAFTIFITALIIALNRKDS